MSLSLVEREELRQRYACRCAYCGQRLGKKWHADHVKPVERKGKWVHTPVGYKHVLTGEMWHPERDTPDNLMPACVPCNIDKHTFSLEGWRRRLEQSAEVLHRNYSTYRHAKRFGLIVEAVPKVIFYFERMYDIRKR